MRVLYAKNGGALAVEAEKEASFDFLFQHIEFRCGEELTEGDLKTITKLLNRHDARIFAFIIKDTLDGGCEVQQFPEYP